MNNVSEDNFGGQFKEDIVWTLTFPYFQKFAFYSSLLRFLGVKMRKTGKTIQHHHAFIFWPISRFPTVTQTWSHNLVHWTPDFDRYCELGCELYYPGSFITQFYLYMASNPSVTHELICVSLYAKCDSILFCTKASKNPGHIISQTPNAATLFWSEFENKTHCVHFQERWCDRPPSFSQLQLHMAHQD